MNSRIIQGVPLSEDLRPYPTNRLFVKDIERRQSLPFSISGGARLADVVELIYFANGSAGTYTASVPLNLQTVPLVSAWYLGGRDKDGVIVDTAAAQLSGTYNGSVFGSAAAGGLKFSWNKTTITFTMLSANVGWPSFVSAQIYYAVYYDDTQVSALGI